MTEHVNKDGIPQAPYAKDKEPEEPYDKWLNNPGNEPDGRVPVNEPEQPKIEAVPIEGGAYATIPEQPEPDKPAPIEHASESPDNFPVSAAVKRLEDKVAYYEKYGTVEDAVGTMKVNFGKVHGRLKIMDEDQTLTEMILQVFSHQQRLLEREQTND